MRSRQVSGNVSAPSDKFNPDREKRLTRWGVDGMDAAAARSGRPSGKRLNIRPVRSMNHHDERPLRGRFLGAISSVG